MRTLCLTLNFAHPLTAAQLAQLEALLGGAPTVQDIALHIDRQRPLAMLAQEIIAAVGLAPAEWQTTPFVINPPGLAPLALALIAELHGRCGYFPPMINMRPVAAALPPRFEVAEIVDLQQRREQGRVARTDPAGP